MIKFRWSDDVVVVMAENFDKDRIEAVSSVSQQTVQFDPKPSDTLYRVNRFEPINYIPDLERVNCLTIHSNPFRMVENLCHRWGYEKGTPLGQYGQRIAEPIMAEERRDFEGLGYDWQPHKDGRLRSRNRKIVIPRDLTNFTSAGVLNPNKSQAATHQALCQSPPLPTEEWVCIEEYYSDEEESEAQAVWTDREVQAHPAAPTIPLLLLPATAITLSAHPLVASLASLFASLIATAPQLVASEDQSISQSTQPAARQTPQLAVQLTARCISIGEGAAEQESQEAISAYYVDLPSDEEEGATAEAQVDSLLEDLELLFQEQLVALAEDAAEQ